MPYRIIDSLRASILQPATLSVNLSKRLIHIPPRVQTHGYMFSLPDKTFKHEVEGLAAYRPCVYLFIVDINAFLLPHFLSYRVY